MMKQTSIKFILLVGIICTRYATKEKKFLKSKDAYFGLTKPGLTPQIFALGIVSDSAWTEHYQVAVSLDGKYCFLDFTNQILLWMSIG